MQSCPFCGAAIDHAAAEVSAAETSRISRACSDASYLRIMLVALIPFAVLIFLPFLSLLGLIGFIFVKYAVVVMTIRWWIKYGRLKSRDTDLLGARERTIVVGVISLIVLAVARVHVFGLPFAI
ncbi:MAG: DUF5305 domain-containing protein [Acidobacteriaceae bacterium]|nr:DUF5305 domain-containing protein [Acidobacteriaceae bacterium]